MSVAPALLALEAELTAELARNILPFWMECAVDLRNGGFVGAISGDGLRDESAPKGAILHARILWTFSAAHRVLGNAAYRDAADRAAEYLVTRFLDPLHGGVYWMVDAAGTPLDERKHVYAQAFAVYALGEHFRATGDPASLERAVEIFRLLEHNAADEQFGGYHEAFSRDWVPLADVRLSERDADERKSANTHLHVLEAYTTLYRAWPDAAVRRRLAAVVELFVERITDPRTGHLWPFFDADWTPKSATVSFGHDIEASWLLLDAVDTLGDDLLRVRVRETALRLADAVLAEGFDPCGGIFNQAEPDGTVDTDKDWWPQAEAVVGFFNAYQETGRDEFLAAAEKTWAFTARHIVDREHGEWHRCVSRNGLLRPDDEKVGPWKCPYHNGRLCLEVIERVQRQGRGKKEEARQEGSGASRSGAAPPGDGMGRAEHTGAVP